MVRICVLWLSNATGYRTIQRCLYFPTTATEGQIRGKFLADFRHIQLQGFTDTDNPVNPEKGGYRLIHMPTLTQVT